jgi:hypothetical protein
LLYINNAILSQNNLDEMFFIKKITSKNGLPSNCIYSASQDHSGNIWFATENGLTKFDGKTYKIYGIKDGLKNLSVYSAYYKNPIVFVHSFLGVDIIMNNKIQTQKLKKISKTYTTNIFFEEIIDDTLIASRRDSIFIFDFKNKNNPILLESSNYNDKGLKYRFYNILKKFNTHYQASYNYDSKSILFVDLIYNQSYLFDTKGKKLYNLFIPEKYKEIRGMYLKQNKFFIVENNSFYEYELVNFKLVYQKKVSFPCTVNSIFYKDGLYYINTLTDGVYILREKGKNISIDQLQITGIEVDTNNQIVLGVKEDYPKYYNHFGKSLNKRINGTNNCKPLLVDNSLAWVDRTTIVYKQKKYNILDLIKTTRVYNKDNILVGTRSFAMLYDLKTGKKVKHLLDKWTVGFCVTQKKDIYIASPSGLYRYGSDGQLKKIKFTNIEDLKVNSVAEDLQGNIWINTAGLGIYVYNPGTKKIQNLQTKDGLLSDNNSNIIIDKKNRKWILSNFGVLVIDGNRFFKINKSEGLMSNEIIDLKVVNDTAWIASNMGLNKYVYVNNNNKIWIPLNINEIKINNQLVDSMPKRLTPIQNKIQFDFIGVFIAAAEEIKYNYRLSYDNTKGKWQKTDQNKLVFENLQHGHYELEIEAYHANYPNIRSKILKIPFVINPHFYQTFVFWLVIFLLLLLISSYFIYKIIKQRKHRELEKAELLAKVNESNLKSLQGQMNPHFVFNSLSTLQNLVLNQKDAEVLEYISEFSKLMRTMLDNSRNDIISLIDEIEFLKNYIDLEHIRYKNGFDIIWTNLLSEDDFEDIYIPTMLIQPLIENAIKHGVSNLNERRGIIDISLKLINDSLLEIKVSDNGNNMVKKGAKHTSTAIKVIKERLELYQKNNQKGTFELIIQPDGASSIMVIPV